MLLPKSLHAGKDMFLTQMGHFFIPEALVVVSGNNLGFYLHILSATFWKCKK